MKQNDKIDAAWEILYHTVYNCTDGVAVCFLLVTLLHDLSLISYVLSFKFSVIGS